MKCRICNSEAREIFQSTVLNKYEVSYFKCDHCGFIQTEEPYWLNEAYSSAINATDTGIFLRNSIFTNLTMAVATRYFGRKSTIVDYAGGHGILTRMLRDIGLDCYWTDKYAENDYARGFEYDKSRKYDLVTAYEVFEHLEDPVPEIEQMLGISQSLLFSTVLLPEPVPGKDWRYYAFTHGQHISFYSYRTLQYIADEFHLHYYSDHKAVHLFSPRKINPFFFRYFSRVMKTGMASFYRLGYRSKTISDHDLLNLSAKHESTV